MKRFQTQLIIVFLFLTIFGCAAPKLKIFSDEMDPLKEFTLKGKAKEKVLVIPVSGLISDQPRKEFLRPKPSMVQEVISQLQRAEKDSNIRAVLFKVNSPGGSATASDILYREILDFKARTNKKVVVSMMDVAASGGYYISLPADTIMAHPTTITGSVGVIFLHPNITRLMEKIGLGVEVNKSGRNKDMGSPFREPTQEEQDLMQQLTDKLGERFVNLVVSHRKISPKALEKISTARVFLGKEAVELGLIDEVGYINDAVKKAITLAGIPVDARVVVYRRTEYPDDNLYNPNVSTPGIGKATIVDFGLPDGWFPSQVGFYYIWKTAVQ